MRALPIVAVLATAAMTAAAVWQITEAPDAVQDVRPTALPSPLPSQPVEVAVEAGQGPQEIGEALERAGVIESAVHFRILVALMGYDGLLQAGSYEFDPGTPVLQAVYRMRRGIVSSRFVTVVEGWRLEQTADALAEQGIPRDGFLQAARAGGYDFAFLDGLRSGQSLEGYVFPATYYLRRSDSAADVVRRMLQAFDANVPQQLRQEAADAGLTLREVITLASIIEREAQVPDERPIMAQVFLKRLRLGIPLEADPTVQYALAADQASVSQFGYWKQDLTRDDLEVNSPYNTYRYGGLPPGPIASPGLDAITAVVHPADTNYLYFVAKPDGSHAFAETFQEHQQNVEKYRSGQ
ncbi:MAG TPA: endolytic transglycosylase MltG [Dehalococcoidia bacterium]|nr:endolytic transglycosylase MltG [Dehalococcoidia bacterium]